MPGSLRVLDSKVLEASSKGGMLRAYEEGVAERPVPVLPQDIKSGRSPLIHAVENNSLSMVQLLLLVRTHPPPPRPASDASPAVTSTHGQDPVFQFRL